MSKTTEISGEERIYRAARDAAATKWGTHAFDALGPKLRRAVVAEEILAFAGRQDESIAGDTVRRIVDHAWTRLSDEFPGV